MPSIKGMFSLVGSCCWCVNNAGHILYALKTRVTCALQSCVAANFPDLDAGLAAQMAPHLLQQTAEAARARADEADLQRIMRMGLGPLDTGDDEALWVCASLASISCTGPAR